jgi:threonine dehydratase
MYHAWRDGHLDPHDRMGTFAEGLATRVPFALTQEILRDRLADFRLVEDDAIRESLAWLVDREHVIVEGACAAPVAVAREMRTDLAG